MTPNPLHPQGQVRTIAGWLEQIQYRPGWKLGVTFDGMDIQLQVSAQVEDSRGSGQPIVVRRTAPVWPELADNRERFLDWLRHELFTLERHESAEWLRWRTGPDAGLPIFDPHRENL